MTENLLIISGLFLAFLEILITQKFMSVFLGEKSGNIAGNILWILYVIYAFFSNMNNQDHNPWLVISANFLFVLVIGIVDREASFKRAAFFSLLINTISMLMEVATIVIMEMLGMELDSIYKGGGYVSESLMFIIVVIAKKTKTKRRVTDIPMRLYVTILSIPVISVFIMNWIFLIAYKRSEYGSFAIISGCFFLLMNYIIFEVYDQISYEAELKAQNRLYCKQLELCSAQASDQEKFYSEIRRTRHDMKNHLTGIYEMIKAGDNKEACAYIERMLKEGINVAEEDISRSGNIIIDSLINHKYLVAKQNGIEFDATVFVPASLAFRSDHLVIILGNLLENALEACYKVEPGKRFIKVEVTYEKGVLNICIKNSCISEKRRGSDGAYFTTKEDKENHGIGLSSVEKAVKYYDGEVMIKDNLDTFTVVAILYGIQ